jgi:hypothetical protein
VSESAAQPAIRNIRSLDIEAANYASFVRFAQAISADLVLGCVQDDKIVSFSSNCA